MFETEPDLIREGGSLPLTLTLQEATGKNVMMLPLGACDDGAHSQNEKMDRKNYIEGVSIVATSFSGLFRLSALPEDERSWERGWYRSLLSISSPLDEPFLSRFT